MFKTLGGTTITLASGEEAVILHSITIAIVKANGSDKFGCYFQASTAGDPVVFLTGTDLDKVEDAIQLVRNFALGHGLRNGPLDEYFQGEGQRVQKVAENMPKDATRAEIEEAIREVSSPEAQIIIRKSNEDFGPLKN